MKQTNKILVTGAAGFIGAHLVKSLLKEGYEVVGLDNLNHYYDVNLKYGRLEVLGGIERNKLKEWTFCQSSFYPHYRFIWGDMLNKKLLFDLFENEHFDIVCNLAAQAGVRYSISNPYAYIESNVVGFLNLLECCRHYPVNHLVYASSSSIYGLNDKVPYAETDKADSPVSLYAATKKSNELMAHAYSKLYSIPTTGVRFFTVYGPWGRPDMAPCLFMKAILNGDPIKVFNNGQMRRDFTYIDDIIAGLMKIIAHPSADPIPFYIYNIGNSAPVELMDFISVIEKTAGKTAIKQMMGMQPGDVVCTYADTGRLEKDFGYKPSTSIEEGIQKFYDWYVGYFNK